MDGISPMNNNINRTAVNTSRCERAVMRAAIEGTLFDEEDTSFVIDTTGSVIYTGDEIIKELRELTLVVYLEESPDDAGAAF